MSSQSHIFSVWNRTNTQLPPTVIYYSLYKKLRVNYPNFQQTAENVLYRLHHYFRLWIYFSPSPLHPPLLMICCDFERQNMEIAQRGSGIYSSITSVTNYSAQHAESVAPVDPFSPLYLIYLEKGLYCLTHHEVHLGTSVHG